MGMSDDQGTCGVEINYRLNCKHHTEILIRYLLFVGIVESNLSSFMVEMKETAHILANAKNNSLVLFDELGRATSNEEGVSIAWSVAEELLGKGCKTFFVTHYPELTELEKMYSGAQNQHLQSIVKEDKNGVDIRYSHKVGNGPCRAQSSYGVDMAGFCGFPEDILKEVRSYE
jgi:DNA mismatch repair ATPase MutS